MRDLLGEEKVGDGGEDGHSPAETGHQAGSPEVRHREDVERAADGQISEHSYQQLLQSLHNYQDCYLSKEKERIVSTEA